ncbi:adenosylmethionine decarboxylase [Vulcanococcus sp.]|jgi:S-adenosylmethionine decarboxylase|uniref:adenosylmethionine decarboxylase n=1 Tax=Vulcanococcus sp. TaxID=2856995 RepID=UPI003236EAE1
MVNSLASLHPNPGWSDPCINQCSPVGKHCILELYHCSPAKLDDEAYLRRTISQAVEEAGATLLNLISHRFTPQGVTGLALLSESHLSIHTWPESQYAAVDVFTCGDHTMPERACQALVQALEAGRYNLRSFLRETPTDLTESLRAPQPNLQAFRG